MRVVVAERDETGLPRGVFGWAGAAGTLSWVDPQSKAAFVFMTQYFGRPGYPLSRELPQAVLADFAHA